jgi:hypothetical protein
VGFHRPASPEPLRKTLSLHHMKTNTINTNNKRNTTSLDDTQHNRNKRRTRCGCWSLQGEVQQNGKDRWRYARLGCKRWICPRCGSRKAKRLRKAIVVKAVEKDLRRFLTLTLDPSKCSAADSVRYLRESWRKFRVYLQRQTGSAVSFIAVVEFQKNGYAHLHVLIDRYVEQGWISEAWQAVGGGRIVDIKQVDIHRVAAYLSKYFTKELLLTGFKPRQRRCTTSRDIVLFAKTEKGKWLLLKFPLEDLMRRANGGILDGQKDDEGFLDWFEVSEKLMPCPPLILSNIT